MDKSLSEFGKEMAHFMPKFIGEVLRRQSRELSVGNITVQQMIILNLLKLEDHLMMSRIAKKLNVTTPAATGLVSRMVKSGLIKRVADEKDRRIVYIEMTKKGTKIIDDIQAARYRMMMDMFRHITPIERKRYLATIKKIYSSIAQEA